MKETLSSDDKFLMVINQIIDNNIDNEEFSVVELARESGLSRSMLHRKLIRLTGKSASELITEKRLMQAKKLLENDEVTVSEIAYKVGYNSPSYFNKVFKKYYLVSPGELRKSASPYLRKIFASRNRKINVLNQKKRKTTIIKYLIVTLAIVTIGSGLYYITSGRTTTKQSIALLPFDNLSINEENQGFADGIYEDLHQRLSRIDGLKVISRTSSEIFRNKRNKTSPEIAHLLGVNYLLEGTAQREVDDVRIIVKLIDARRDECVLTKKYDSKVQNVFRNQSEIARDIATALSIYLTDNIKLEVAMNYTTNLKALEYYQLGRFYLNKRIIKNIKTSLMYFKKAIDEDPDYALAYAEMANAYYLLTWYSGIKDKEQGRQAAVDMARKALQKDKHIAEAHAVLGSIYQEFDWDFKAAEEEYLKAIAINPNYSTSYQYYAELLSITGRNELAREFINKAKMLDPYSFIIRNISTVLYMRNGEFEKALEENSVCKELNIDADFPFYNELVIYWLLEDDEAALECVKKYGIQRKRYHPHQADSIYNVSGMNGIMGLVFSNESVYYAMIGENEKALDQLELEYNTGSLKPFPFGGIGFSKLQSHPRFIRLKKKMGLEF